MKFSKFWLMLIVSLAFMLVIAACGSDDEAGGDVDDETEEVDENGDDATEDSGERGSIVAGMYSAPGHQFNPLFYSDAYEANILDFTHEALARLDENLDWEPSLAESWEINDDYTEITFTLNDGVTWHDGEPFTSADVVFTYETLMDEDYVAAGGVRTNYVSDLESVEAIDPLTVKFTYTDTNINAVFDAAFIIVPEHVFGDVPVLEMPDYSASRNAGEIIGTGPFQLTDMLEGEQYVLTAYDDYWKGEPGLASITWRVIEQSVMPGLLGNGDIDMIAAPNGVPPADFGSVDALDHINTYVFQDFGYQYMGFKLHHRTSEDVENGVIDPDNWIENEKVADVRVRQAVVYAIDREGIVEGLLHGMGTVLNANFPEASWAFDESAVNPYEYSPETAEALLDEAGYVDVTGDGFREDPDGNEWVLNLDYPTGNQIRERSAPIIQEDLEAVGIKVNLRQPREAGPHFDLVEEDDHDWDLYLAGWSLSAADPDPSALWLSTAPYNYTRWNDPVSDELIRAGIQAPEAFDQDYRKQAYSDWAAHMSEQVPQVFLYSNDNIYAYNAALQNVKEYPAGIYTDSYLWELAE
ncbi:ABC transporter substrate-binding protein [Evansella cellulosilytica]|uniref:Extracellular solute-binding protein family 5 n=1 Tax=Evansella cellulosilytica (strain ATCC 21833 / DSM 2522 / FERM P-1141 / JCM 9156 / N-4) TaxID=649639 RepID=E6TRL6_EVAC2|nr:ABC transporter substrate-binding protein [Evansella cellulosilytica]ADU28310.1 extracellular solute-binding protein family 5 [Evansella cellulosilytica DSM 2522]